MTEANIREILNLVSQGRLSVPQGLARLRHLPFADLGFAKVDLHRKLRRGIPEVVFGERKTAQQIAAIGERVIKAGQDLIVTRLDPAKARVAAAQAEVLRISRRGPGRACPAPSAAARRTRHR